jgi:hypothetical protein
MKILFFLIISTISLTVTADSFELTKNGKVYLCEEKTVVTSGSLSTLCRLAKSGTGQTIYHANGTAFTYSAGTKGATWYHDNGKAMTYSAGTKGATWYHRNGNALTYSSGTVGATWYYDNGAAISYSMGTAGATIYYKNGSALTYSAPAMSEEELSYPCDYLE